MLFEESNSPLGWRLGGQRSAADRRFVPLLLDLSGGRPIAEPEYGYLCRPNPAPVPGNSAELLDDGGEALGRMLEGIRKARSSVRVEMYTFAADFVGCEFARVLAEQAARGLEVRVLFDDAGCRYSPRSFFGWMRQRGVRVHRVNPIRLPLLGGRFFPWRDHRKLMVVDGSTAFVGGINLSRAAIPSKSGGWGWRDSAVRVSGPVVSEIASSFDECWRELDSGSAGGTAMPETVAPAGEVPALVIESHPLGPRRFGSVLRHAVRQARRRVWIANPYFLPPRALRRALRGAAHRGVEVRVLLPSRSDCSFVLRAGQRLYESFLHSGIRLFEWRGPMMHSKTAVVDGLWSTIGSFNLDPLSLLRNRELNLVLLGRPTGERFESMFARDFASACEIEGNRWSARGLLRRLTETLCAEFRFMF